MSSYQKIRMHLLISREEYLSYYRGETSSFQARTTDGRVVRFPARILRPFVGRDGVQGLFEITFNQRFRLVRIRRLDRKPSQGI